MLGPVFEMLATISDMEPFEGQVLINADCSTVWNVITDDANYTLWPSGIVWIKGELRHGSTIKIRTTTGERQAFRLRVRQVPGTVMIWTGRMPWGLSRGVRTFAVTARDGLAHLLVREEFSGLLLPLARKAMPGLGPSLSGYVNAVNVRAEILHRPRTTAPSPGLPATAEGTEGGGSGATP